MENLNNFHNDGTKNVIPSNSRLDYNLHNTIICILDKVMDCIQQFTAKLMRIFWCHYFAFCAHTHRDTYQTQWIIIKSLDLHICVYCAHCRRYRNAPFSMHPILAHRAHSRATGGFCWNVLTMHCKWCTCIIALEVFMCVRVCASMSVFCLMCVGMVVLPFNASTPMMPKTMNAKSF